MAVESLCLQADLWHELSLEEPLEVLGIGGLWLGKHVLIHNVTDRAALHDGRFPRNFSELGAGVGIKRRSVWHADRGVVERSGSEGSEEGLLKSTVCSPGWRYVDVV